MRPRAEPEKPGLPGFGATGGPGEASPEWGRPPPPAGVTEQHAGRTKQSHLEASG